MLILFFLTGTSEITIFIEIEIEIMRELLENDYVGFTLSMMLELESKCFVV